jgi:hypothetical protein
MDLNEMNPAKVLAPDGAISVRPTAGIAVSPPAKGKLTVQRFIVPYRVYGAGEYTLVFINGVQQSMAMWHSFVRRFSRSALNNWHKACYIIMEGKSHYIL